MKVFIVEFVTFRKLEMKMSMMDDDGAEMRNISFAKSKKKVLHASTHPDWSCEPVWINYDDAAKLISFTRFF